MGEVVKFGEAVEKPTLLDVAACLRQVAADLESGKHGVCLRAALVLRCAGEPPIVFGQGETSITQTYMDLHAGAAELLSMQNPGRS